MGGGEERGRNTAMLAQAETIPFTKESARHASIELLFLQPITSTCGRVPHSGVIGRSHPYNWYLASTSPKPLGSASILQGASSFVLKCLSGPLLISLWVSRNFLPTKPMSLTTGAASESVFLGAIAKL